MMAPKTTLPSASFAFVVLVRMRSRASVLVRVTTVTGRAAAASRSATLERDDTACPRGVPRAAPIDRAGGAAVSWRCVNPGERAPEPAGTLLAELLGESRGMQALRLDIARVLERIRDARRLPPILIEGETGTGKGLVAQLLHRAGNRRGEPFVALNCAAIPETLLEAELFGYEAGTFTDARRRKDGLFQAANGGVLFLDEIALLSEAVQAKLLTALEERRVRRLGAIIGEAVDVWVIAATNTDLASAVTDRKFRDDLYHRLAVVTLRLPPLRERDRDVLELARRFLARLCEDYGIPPRRLLPDAEAKLTAHSWPGNVR